MLKLTLARMNLYLGKKWLDCMGNHLVKREEYLSMAKTIGGYTPVLKYKDCYHKIWCYLGLGMSRMHSKIIDKLA